MLFTCTRNSGPSQLAEAYFRHMVGQRASCMSAGTEPAASVDESVGKVLAEMGVVFDGQPRLLTPELLAGADRIISLGCQPVPERATDVWDIPDTAGKSLDEVRRIRDQVRARVEILIVDLGVGRPGTRQLNPSDSIL